MTCKIANVLKRYGVKKGDRVAIYMPVVPLLVASMMACARIGAIHRLEHANSINHYLFNIVEGAFYKSIAVHLLSGSIVFAGFSAESLKGRILDGK